MTNRLKAVRAAFGICTVALFLLAFAPVVSADITFGPQGSGAGQTNNPTGLAVDDSSGDLYVADSGNNRVDVFDENGNFIRAFGWGVDTGASALQTCTTASTCQAGLPGAAAGQFNGPNRIAVDGDPASPSFHDVYVYDSRNNRVERFTPAGAFVLAFGDGVDQISGGDVCTAASGHACKAGVEGFGANQFNHRVDLTVGLAGAVYVTDAQGDGGFVLADSRVQVFDSTGALTGQPLSKTGSGIPLGLVSDSAGNFYLAYGTGISKYGPSGTCLAFCGSPLNPSSNIRGLAVDRSTGKIFVSDIKAPGTVNSTDGVVNLYDSAGTQLSTIYGDGLRRMAALAARHTVNGDVYAVNEAGASSKIVHIPVPPPGPVILPGAQSTTADPVGNVKATLNAKVNPEGTATTYHFDYLDDVAYQSGGFTNPGTLHTPELAVGSDFALHLLAHEITNLVPETTYHFRVVATDGTHTTTGPEATFTTREPFEFGAAYSTDVGTDTATLNAELNPLSIPSTGYFEYVADAIYQADKATGNGFQHAAQVPDVSGGDPPLDFGDANDELIARSAKLHSLSPGTTYHYRLIATDPFASKPGPEGTLRTFALADPLNTSCPNQAFRTATLSAGLPDCRAYEMVSPPDKQGADIVTLNSVDLNRPARIDQAAPGGEALTYSSYRAFADAASAPWTSQYLASRDPGNGWQTQGISPPGRSLSVYTSTPLDSRFQAFSADLCVGFLFQDSDVALAAGDQAGFTDLYRSRNCENPTGYDLLTTAAPIGGQPAPTDYDPRVQGFSADGSLAVFRANAKLASNASGATAHNQAGNVVGPIFQLYLADAGALRLVSILPDGSAAGVDSSVGTYGNGGALGYRDDTLARAVSDDGTRVFWTATSIDAGNAAQPKLYLRLNADRDQSPLAHGAASGTGNLSAGSPTVTSLVAAAGTAAFTLGSPTVTLLETTTGEFLAGQPVTANGKVPAGTTILSCSPSCGKEATSLTLSANATATSPSSSILSRGPQPFSVGQSVSGEGIPPGTTITAVAPGSLTLSANATEKQTNAALSATSACTDPTRACTLPVSESVSSEPAVFDAATPDGSKALFHFSPFGKGPHAGQLYAYDVVTQMPTLIAGGFRGILGASDDLTKVYFASTQVLSAGASAGQDNLYLWEAGQGTRFIATFSIYDSRSFTHPPAIPYAIAANPFDAEPYFRASRVSPDGEHAAFMTRNALTASYDNADAASGQLDSEVYRYDAAADGGAGQLTCVSCNPSGARPIGRDFGGGVADSWISARIPGFEYPMHGSRVLSDDGSRLFFESFDALLPADTNGALDVYQWEAPGTGECNVSAADYFPANGGCLSLISTGQSPDDSRFVDASTDGSDVFLLSGQQLHGADQDSLIDIYDARVDGGFPAPPLRPPPCDLDADACEGPGSAAPAPAGAGSAVFEGPGNARKSPVKPCRRGFVKRHGKCGKKPHKKSHRHHNRATADRRAAR